MWVLVKSWWFTQNYLGLWSGLTSEPLRRGTEVHQSCTMLDLYRYGLVNYYRLHTQTIPYAYITYIHILFFHISYNIYFNIWYMCFFYHLNIIHIFHIEYLLITWFIITYLYVYIYFDFFYIHAHYQCTFTYFTLFLASTCSTALLPRCHLWIFWWPPGHARADSQMGHGRPCHWRETLMWQGLSSGIVDAPNGVL